MELLPNIYLLSRCDNSFSRIVSIHVTAEVSARNDRELFGADYAANAVFEIGNSKMSIGNH